MESRWDRRKTALVAGFALIMMLAWPGAAGAVTEDAPPATFAYQDGGPGQTATVDGVDQAVTDSVVRMYLAVFDRQPDAEGLVYWVEQYVGGTGLRDIAAAFMVSTEWTNRYGAVDDERFVDLLYGNVLKRLPDDEGRNYWRTTLADGVQRDELLIQFSESAEFVTKTGTTEPRPPYPPVPADSGSGRRIVYANTAQRVWLIDADEQVTDSYPVSGRRDTPSPGTYSVYSKSERAWAGHDGITMDHMVRFARGRSLAIGFHSIPRYASGRPMQDLDQLGTYQSAGCVRQDWEKAEMLYHWADIGTTVVVLD